MNISPSYTKIIREIIEEFQQKGQMYFSLDEIKIALANQKLGLDDIEKRKIKDALSQMKRKKELISEGLNFRYQPLVKIDPTLKKVYRAVRAYKGTFISDDIARVSESKQKSVQRILTSLAAAGYIRECGYNGLNKVWLASTLCRGQVEPPPINFSNVDFILERQAIARLAEIFLVANPKHPETVKIIREQLNILNGRFARKDFQNDT